MQSLATAGTAGCRAGRGLQPSARYAAPRQARPRQVQRSQCRGPGTGALQVRSGHVPALQESHAAAEQPGALRPQVPGRSGGDARGGSGTGRGRRGARGSSRQRPLRTPGAARPALAPAPSRPPSAIPGHAAPPASRPRAQKPQSLQLPPESPWRAQEPPRVHIHPPWGGVVVLC